MAPRLSLVIPARNEERYLPRLLDSVDAARERYRAGREAVEVIVADNVSTDSTAAIARGRGCRVVTVEKRVIGAVRNGGARSARGAMLAFVDADTRIHPETFNAIEEALEGGWVVAGATGVSLERWSAGLALTYALFLPMVWLTGMDTGVIFCRREDFVATGGYSEERLFAEDVEFLWAMKRLGRSRGQRVARLRSVKATASVRKFDHYGDWHYLGMFARTAYWLVFSRPSLGTWVREYWYGDRGRPPTSGA